MSSILGGPKTWREKQAAHVNPVDAALAAWRQHPERDDTARMYDALDAAEGAECDANECDEPGCNRRADCGWPVPDGGGYRRTCGGHTNEKQAHTKTPAPVSRDGRG